MMLRKLALPVLLWLMVGLSNSAPTPAHGMSSELGISSSTETQLASSHGIEPGISISPTTAPVSKNTLLAEGTRHTILVEGHPLAMWAKVPADPKGSIVFLHGRTWSGVPDFDLQVEGEQRSVMDAFVERGYATYALDLRGYGESPRDDSGWLTPDRAAKDLAAALVWVHEQEENAGAGERPYLFGWSMGSTVAQLCAQRHPDLMAGLILFGYWKDPDQDLPGPPESNTPANPERRVNTAEAAASDFIRPEVISQKAIDAYVEAALEADPIRVDWKDLDQFNELDPALVKVPTLLVQGEHDPLARTAPHARLFQRLGHPDRQWVMIEGGTHAAILEDTLPRVVKAVVGFMERGG